MTPPAKTISQQHAEWVGMLRPDGPFIAVPQLSEAFKHYLDDIEDVTINRLRLAWSEVTEAPDTLTPAWTGLILRELLDYTGQAFGEGPSLPADLVSGPGTRPDGIVYGPDGSGGRAERLYLYRRPYDESLTTATRHQLSPAEQAAALCRDRSVPLALLTNGTNWVLVHARPNEPTTTANFDADLWLEERDLLRAFFTLLRAPFVAAGRLADLFAKSAAAQAEVTDKLGEQVRRAVELLVGELSRLDRESSGALLGAIEPRQIYRGALTVMMRLVFLLYAEEHALLPVNSGLYADSYSVSTLYDQLQAERNLHGDQVAGLRAAAWPRLLATFSAVYAGCENDQMRIPPYGGGMFDPKRYPWLDQVAITDLVTAEMLRSLIILQRKGGAAERLSYKGLDVEQIGHVYEGLLEFSCLRIDKPYLGLIGKLEPELPLSEVEEAQARDDFETWLKKQCDATPTQIRKALDSPSVDEPTLDAACDNDKELSAHVWPLRGLLRLDLRERPAVFPADSLIITQTGDRRATGTHYTPRKLANEIVQYTLEPLCYNPGPADGVAVGERNVRPARELLELKVLDPAMGSAAFLVSACRYLSERVVSAWERDGYPETVVDVLGFGFDRDDALLEARRIVAARCIYGVDRDDAAVELGKLSLWLVTLSKDKPFSFLDHALRHGDSLVGLISEDQVTSFHLDPATGHAVNARLEGTIDEIAEPVMARVKELRLEIAKDPVRDTSMGAVLAAKLAEADSLAERLRVTADAVAAAALSTAGQPWEVLNDRLTALSDDVQALLHNHQHSPMERAFRRQLERWLTGTRAEPIRPFHWPLEFPEVFSRGKFDAIVSNPPFMGAPGITENLGDDYHSYLAEIFPPESKRVDLCAYFLRRAVDISRTHMSMIGMLATNSIREGNTRRGGLDQLLQAGEQIFRARRDFIWPGTASVVASSVYITGRHWAGIKYLNDIAVPDINSLLEADDHSVGEPEELQENRSKCFQGGTIWGDGFYLSSQLAETMLASDERNKKVVRRAIGGQELNSGDVTGERWVIDFGEMTEIEAARFILPFDHLAETVRPWRINLDRSKYKRIVDSWWKHFHAREDLYTGIKESKLTRVIARSRVSRRHMLAFEPNDIFYLDAVIIFLFDDTSDFSVLQSSIHEAWCQRYGSRLKSDLRYGAKNCFNTFPRPSGNREALHRAGEQYIAARHAVMDGHEVGLTDAYNLLDDRNSSSSTLAEWRNATIMLDSAVAISYGWSDLDLGHGFHKTDQGTQFTIGPIARMKVLDKLLAINNYRYQQEVKRGLHNKKNSRSKPRVSNRDVPLLDDGALFSPPGAMF